MFKTQSSNLKLFFETLNPQIIHDNSNSIVYSNGLDYFKYNSVSNAYFKDDYLAFEADVEGTRKYKVKIFLKDNIVDVGCNCPFGGICKHIVATLLYASDSNTKVEIEKTENNHAVAKGYLAEMSKTDLVKLVMKYAPPDFILAIANKHKGRMKHKKYS